MNRTEIAAMCLQGILSNTNVLPAHYEDYVKASVKATDALLAELAKNEPKEHPKQRPWKVGDRVRIVENISGHDFLIGTIVTIKWFKDKDNGWCAVDDSGEDWYILESEAELITD